MAWDVSFDPVDAEDAIAWFADRLILTTDQIEQLRADVAKRAFYVSGVAQLDVVAQVWDAIDGALKNGTTLDDFKAQIGDALQASWQGTVDNPPARIETIFRTNVQTAYTAGRYEQATDPDTVEDRPFWMFDAILDKATTEVCDKCDGTVRPADDAWWKSHLPPLHFNCRSHFVTLTHEQAHAEGVTKKPPSASADRGFGSPPGQEPWRALKRDYPPELWKTFESKKPELDENGRRPLVDWATDAKTALADVKKDDGAAARALVREHVTALGLRSYDEEQKRSGAGRLVFERDAGLEQLQKLAGNRAYHEWDGSIVVSTEVTNQAKTALAHIIDHPDSDVPADPLRGIATLFHEEIHGCSPINPASYKGVGVALEEAGTEILARRAIRELLRDDSVFPLPKFGKMSDALGRYKTEDDPVRFSYNPYIKGLMHAVAEVISAKDVGPRLEAAFIEIRSAKGAHFVTGDDQMNALIDSKALGLDAKQKGRLRKLLTQGDLLTRYPYVEDA